MRYIIFAVLLVGCGRVDISDSKHEVTGETRHLVGVDLGTFTDLFAASCRLDCRSNYPKEPLDECTDACIADYTMRFLELINESKNQ